MGTQFRDELLAGEARLDGHDQDEVHVAEEREDGGNGGAGPEHKSGPRAEAADFPQQRARAGDDFDVEGDVARAGADERLGEARRLLNHQVHVHGQRGRAAHSLDDVRAKGEVRDEVAVHDVHVMPIRSGPLDGSDLISQTSQVARQDRWGNNATHGFGLCEELE